MKKQSYVSPEFFFQDYEQNRLGSLELRNANDGTLRDLNRILSLREVTDLLLQSTNKPLSPDSIESIVLCGSSVNVPALKIKHIPSPKKTVLGKLLHPAKDVKKFHKLKTVDFYVITKEELDEYNPSLSFSKSVSYDGIRFLDTDYEILANIHFMFASRKKFNAFYKEGNDHFVKKIVDNGFGIVDTGFFNDFMSTHKNKDYKFEWHREDEGKKPDYLNGYLKFVSAKIPFFEPGI